MTSNNWLMKRDALHAARKCSKLIEQRLGLKLSLAHPSFLSMLGDYASLYDCEDLSRAYSELAAYAPRKQAAAMRRKLNSVSQEQKIASPRCMSTRILPEQIEN